MLEHKLKFLYGDEDEDVEGGSLDNEEQQVF